MIEKKLLLVLLALTCVFAFEIYEYPNQPTPEGKLAGSQQNANISFVWDDNTTYANDFAIQGLNVTKKTIKDEFVQITGQKPLGNYSRTVFRINNYGGNLSGIYVGVLTANRKQFQTSGGSYEKNSSAYEAIYNRNDYGGSLFIDGVQKIYGQQGLGVYTGGLIEMKVALAISAVTFTNLRNYKSYTYGITQAYRKQPIYAFACMNQQGASVEIVATE